MLKFLMTLMGVALAVLLSAQLDLNYEQMENQGVDINFVQANLHVLEETKRLVPKPMIKQDEVDVILEQPRQQLMEVMRDRPEFEMMNQRMEELAMAEMPLEEEVQMMIQLKEEFGPFIQESMEVSGVDWYGVREQLKDILPYGCSVDKYININCMKKSNSTPDTNSDENVGTSNSGLSSNPDSRPAFKKFKAPFNFVSSNRINYKNTGTRPRVYTSKVNKRGRREIKIRKHGGSSSLSGKPGYGHIINIPAGVREVEIMCKGEVNSTARTYAFLGSASSRINQALKLYDVGGNALYRNGRRVKSLKSVFNDENSSMIAWSSAPGSKGARYQQRFIFQPRRGQKAVCLEAYTSVRCGNSGVISSYKIELDNTLTEIEVRYRY